MVLSPSGVALVCSGGQLELTCTTAGAFLEWDFHISENGTTTTHGRLVSSQAGVILVPIMTDSITFNFSRISLPGSVPLVSKLVMITERSSINRIEVMCICIDVVTNSAASTTVVVMNENSVLQGMLYNLTSFYYSYTARVHEPLRWVGRVSIGSKSF